MMETLKKRYCDININVRPLGCKFVLFEMMVGKEKFEFMPSSAVASHQFGALVSAIYSLFFEGDDYHEEWNKNLDIVDENNVIQFFRSKVLWDNEGDTVDILFTRKADVEIDYDNDEIIMEIYNYDDLLKKYILKTKDLCYAVAKAFTEVIKKYGFYGYRYSTENDFFIIHQLLYIKSFALGNFEARERVKCDSDFVYKTDIEKEIELLLFDM